MRILLIGATGSIGLECIRQAVERRWAVTAVVRSPEELGTLPPYVEVAPGSAFDPQAIADAAAGCDAVLSAIGSSAGFLGRGSTSVQSNAAAALAAGMQHAGVDRLVFCTSAGVEPRDPGEVLPYRFIIKPFLQRTYDDMTVTEKIIRSSALDWTLVRPARLTNRPGRSAYRTSARFRPPRGTAIPRADVAAFMLDQVADPTWRHATPTLSRGGASRRSSTCCRAVPAEGARTSATAGRSSDGEGAPRAVMLPVMLRPPSRGARAALRAVPRRGAG